MQRDTTDLRVVLSPASSVDKLMHFHLAAPSQPHESLSFEEDKCTERPLVDGKEQAKEIHHKS